MMSIDMDTLDTVGEPIEVDESVEAGVTQSMDIETDDLLLMSSTIPSSKSFVLTGSRLRPQAKSPLMSTSLLRIHTFITGCRPVTTFQRISNEARSIHLPLVDPPSILPRAPCPVSSYSIIAMTAYSNSLMLRTRCEESHSAHPAPLLKTNLCQFLRSNDPSLSPPPQYGTSPRRGTVHCITTGLSLHRKYTSVYPPQIPTYSISNDY